MDCFTDVLTTFLGLGTFQLCYCLCRVRELSDFIKNVLICVPKMNEGLVGLPFLKHYDYVNITIIQRYLTLSLCFFLCM